MGANLSGTRYQIGAAVVEFPPGSRLDHGTLTGAYLKATNLSDVSGLTREEILSAYPDLEVELPPEHAADPDVMVHVRRCEIDVYGPNATHRRQ
jgi:hypothetical protein